MNCQQEKEHSKMDEEFIDKTLKILISLIATNKETQNLKVLNDNDKTKT